MMLEFSRVGIRFGDQPPAVSDVSFKLNERDKLVVIGETGSGKSVLLLSILRMLPPGASVIGSILFRGSDLLRCSRKELRSIRGAQIAYIPQGSGNGLNPLYTIRRQMTETICRQAGCTRQRGRAQAVELLNQFDMDGHRISRLYPFMLSGGMRQRVLVAMGIAANAQLILADEPTKGLDEHRIQMITEAFARLSDRTLLCVTHDLRFARQIANRIVVMYASQLIEAAPAKAFFRAPLHPYARAMLAALPENGMHVNMGFAPPRADTEVQSGCHFYERCPLRTERCGVAPPLRRIGQRNVRCWNIADANGSDL